MKSIICLFWLLSSQLCMAQSLVVSDSDDQQIYNFVLEAYLKGKPSIQFAGLVFIEYNYLTSQNLPDKIGAVKLKQVEINKRLFRNKRHITILRIVPMRFINGKFVVKIIEFEANYEKKKRNINLFNTENGRQFIFKYDCIKNELISEF